MKVIARALSCVSLHSLDPSPEDFLDAEIEARLSALPDLIEGAVKSQQVGVPLTVRCGLV